MEASSVCGVGALVAQIEAAAGISQLRARRAGTVDFDAETLTAILDEAARLSDEVLAPFDRAADKAGCRLEDGRVVLAPGHRAAWEAFRSGGWTALDLPQEHGGHALPAVVAIAAQELFDRGSVSFGMLPGSMRAAARLLAAHGEPAMAAEWIARFATGEWGSTICMSEPDAGSDVSRIRTAARRDAGGGWRVTGEKIWISYGDHDLTDRIGHMVLARTGGAAAGTRGLSLFLVPDRIEDAAGASRPNGVVVRRIEEKLGLHASPTCAIGFEEAQARLIGSEGRGVPQLFSMIATMRLQCGTQALGLASACYAAALAYAQERRQGGAPDAPPVPIVAHADVQLVLAGMASRIATLRGLVYTAGIAQDLAGTDEPGEWAALLGWLLPIAKNSAAEAAFTIASEALLLFGGAGYTTEWPIEQYLRDARVLAIFEGTTAMQAQDLVRRRWLVAASGYEAFVRAARRDLDRAPAAVAASFGAGLAAIDEATAWLRDSARTEAEILAAARHALLLASEVAHGWIATRLILSGTADGNEALAAMGRHALTAMEERLDGPLRAMRAAARQAACLTQIAG